MELTRTFVRVGRCMRTGEREAGSGGEEGKWNMFWEAMIFKREGEAGAGETTRASDAER